MILFQVRLRRKPTLCTNLSLTKISVCLITCCLSITPKSQWVPCLLPMFRHISKVEWESQSNYMDVFPKLGVSPNHPLNNRVFHYFNHPFLGVLYPIFLGNTHIPNRSWWLQLHRFRWILNQWNIQVQALGVLTPSVLNGKMAVGGGKKSYYFPGNLRGSCWLCWFSGVGSLLSSTWSYQIRQSILNKETKKQKQRVSQFHICSNDSKCIEHSISIIISCAHANISWCSRPWLSHNPAFYSCHAALGFRVSSCHGWVNLPEMQRMVQRWDLYVSNRLVPEDKDLTFFAPAWRLLAHDLTN